MPAVDAPSYLIPQSMAAEFTAAGHHYGIPPVVLAAVAWIESRMGANRGPSSAGAIGLMQFMPGTAAELGINPRDDRAAIWGAAKYLDQLGYQRDPFKALASYNAGPGNWQAGKGYAAEVQTLARAAAFVSALRTAGGRPGSSPSQSSRSSGSPAGPSSSGDSFSRQLGELTLAAVLVISGSVLSIVGAKYAFAPNSGLLEGAGAAPSNAAGGS